MFDLIDRVLAWISRWCLGTDVSSRSTAGLRLGVVEGSSRPEAFSLPHSKRAEHIAILGKTGQGKSSLLKALAARDIASNRGFIAIDLHGDTTPHLLALLAAEERRRHVDLSDRVVVIEPADPEYAVGLNVLQTDRPRGDSAYVQVAEIASLLKQRWHLEAFGARTEELLRNSLLVLVDNGLTLLEVAPLLTNAAFRAACLQRVQSADVRAYFTDRYNTASEAMQGTWRDAVLNKLSTFTTDPHFRYILGQRTSTVDLRDALDRGCWVLLQLDKGRLGEQAATLGALFLTALGHALFARQRRELVTLYADELQNLVAFDTGIDTWLAEARKFGVGICCANQFLDQYPPTMRSAVLSVGTHLCFQVASQDAERMAAVLGGGHHLQTLLRNLRPRHLVVKTGHLPWRHVRVDTVDRPPVSGEDLYRRSRARWARLRREVEDDIAGRVPRTETTNVEAIDDWA